MTLIRGWWPKLDQSTLPSCVDKREKHATSSRSGGNGLTGDSQLSREIDCEEECTLGYYNELVGIVAPVQ